METKNEQANNEAFVEQNANQIADNEAANIKNPMKYYFIVGLAIFIILISLFYSLFFKDKDEVVDEKEKTSFATEDKSFLKVALSKDKEDNTSGIQSLPIKEAQNDTYCPKCNPNNPMYESCLIAEGCKAQPSVTNLQSSKRVPKIYKFGSVMVASNANGNGGSGGNGGNNLALQEKPNTLFEFGQNGAVNLQAPNLAGANLMGASSNTGRGEDDDTGKIYKPTAASYSNMNPSLLLQKGTYIGCSLKTRLVSEIKGGIACVISNDVYSANGHTLLIEKGSLVSGTYSNEGMDDGSNRLYVIWQEIRTPNNIIIPVFSGASDTLGGAGLEGWVDNHYFKRFGSAILISMIDDVFGAITERISRRASGNENYYDYSENTREGVGDLASKTLEKMIDIKPTLYKNQGDLVGIYVNKDIDFSAVYELRSKRK